MAVSKFFPVRSVGELSGLIENNDTRIIAGGTTFSSEDETQSSGCLLDITGVSELNFIHEKTGRIEIGPLMSLNDIMNSKLVQRKASILAEACNGIGNDDIRSRGSVGGALAWGAGSSDVICSLVALKAKIYVQVGTNIHDVEIDNFLRPEGGVDLETNGFITKISFPCLGGRWGASYKKKGKSDLTHPAEMNLAVNLELDRDDQIYSVRIAIGSAAASVFRARSVEKELRGKALSKDSIDNATSLLLKDFRRQAAKKMTDLSKEPLYRHVLGETLMECYEQALDKEFVYPDEIEPEESSDN